MKSFHQKTNGLTICAIFAYQLYVRGLPVLLGLYAFQYEPIPRVWVNMCWPSTLQKILVEQIKTILSVFLRCVKNSFIQPRITNLLEFFNLKNYFSQSHYFELGFRVVLTALGISSRGRSHDVGITSKILVFVLFLGLDIITIQK